MEAWRSAAEPGERSGSGETMRACQPTPCLVSERRTRAARLGRVDDSGFVDRRLPPGAAAVAGRRSGPARTLWHGQSIRAPLILKPRFEVVELAVGQLREVGAA